MSQGWRKISIVLFIALIALSVMLAVFGSASTNYTAESVAKDYSLPIGQSMFENQSITGTTNPVTDATGLDADVVSDEIAKANASTVTEVLA